MGVENAGLCARKGILIRIDTDLSKSHIRLYATDMSKYTGQCQQLHVYARQLEWMKHGTDRREQETTPTFYQWQILQMTAEGPHLATQVLGKAHTDLTKISLTEAEEGSIPFNMP
ncbi:hypothetical protein KI387_006214, partial [Taxus chinensis]